MNKFTMDTTSSSIQTEEQQPYVSCIRVDGIPILPPLMTEERRAEMRLYRQLAVEKEQSRQLLKPSKVKEKEQISVENNSGTLKLSPLALSNISHPSKTGVQYTSTPNTGRSEIGNSILISQQIQKVNIPKSDFNEEDKENSSLSCIRNTNLTYNKVSESTEEIDPSLAFNSVSSSSVDDEESPKKSIKDKSSSSLEHLPDTSDSSENEESHSGGNFASAASSTGTFIIRSSLSKTRIENDSEISPEEVEEKSEGEVESIIEEEQIEPKQKNTTAESTILYKRKRPARYFETNDEEEITQSSFGSQEDPSCTTASTSLSKYMANSAITTPTVNSTPGNLSTITPPLPNSIQGENISSKLNSNQQSPSFTINMDFAATALALSFSKDKLKESPKNRQTAKATRKSIKYFDTPPKNQHEYSSPREIGDQPRSYQNQNKSLSSSRNLSGDVTDPNFDFILTKEIPSSAEKYKKNSDGNEDEECSGSDKENLSICSGGNKKHVRKLSYTLLAPSEILLAVTDAGGEFVDGSTISQSQYAQQPFPTLPTIIQSAPSSVGVSSTMTTPSKKDQEQKIKDNHIQTPSSKELNAQMDKVQVTLQQLSLGKGKKAHLDRYLGELKLASPSETKEGIDGKVYLNKSYSPLNSSLNTGKDTSASNYALSKLEKLMELYQNEAKRMKEKFEKEKAKILNEIGPKEMEERIEKSDRELSMTESSALRMTGKERVGKDQSVFETFSTTNTSCTEHASMPSPSILADTSNLRNFYISNETPTKKLDSDSSVFTTNSSLHKFEEQQQQHGSETFLGNKQQSGNGMGSVGLSKIQKKVPKMSPSIYHQPSDAQSPLLKGLVFPDPLDRPKMGLMKIPSQAFDPKMKPKFDKLSAAVKGFLVRRLLHTEKIQIIIQTIRDTVELVLKLYEECKPTDKGFHAGSQDEGLHRRLLQQLTGACGSFHDVFFKLTIQERMALIANDREKLKAKAMRNMSRYPTGSPSNKSISNATLKSIERRLSQSRPPGKKENLSSRKSKRSPSKSTAAININSGSLSVKPKAVKSFNLSPKRRRMSYWSEKSSVLPSKSTTSSSRTFSSGSSTVSEFNKLSIDSNGNKWRPSTVSGVPTTESERSNPMYSARETSQSSGYTFLIPPTRLKAKSNNNGNNSRTLNTNTRTSVGSGGANSSGRASTGAKSSINLNSGVNKAPWKK